jgi:hypothetical protein
MMDRWLGRLLDELEHQNAFEDTLIIFTTDHGHMLGEHGLTGKNLFHAWNEMCHIPLLVHLPGGRNAGEHRDRLTQNIDIMPTLLEHFGIPFEHAIHGRSWTDILESNAPSRRQAALYGWFGQTVNVTDGRFTYFRAPATPDNQPLYHYFLSPGTSKHVFGYHDIITHEFYDEAEFGKFLPYTSFPVIRSKRNVPVSEEWGDNRLYDIEEDPSQSHNLAGTEKEPYYVELLKRTMKAMDAPDWQFERTGLTPRG